MEALTIDLHLNGKKRNFPHLALSQVPCLELR